MARSMLPTRHYSKRKSYYVSFAAISFILFIIFAFLLLSYRPVVDENGHTVYFWTNPFTGLDLSDRPQNPDVGSGLYIFFWVMFFLFLLAVFLAHGAIALYV